MRPPSITTSPAEEPTWSSTTPSSRFAYFKGKCKCGYRNRNSDIPLCVLKSPQSSQGQLSHGISSVGVRGLPHTFSSSSQLQSAVAAAALVSRPGKHGHVSHHSVQSSKVSSSGFGGSRNIRGGSASSTAWKKQSNSNTGRLTMNNPSPTVATDICSLSNSCLVQNQPTIQ